jgi:hypothetical protein
VTLCEASEKKLDEKERISRGNREDFAMRAIFDPK